MRGGCLTAVLFCTAQVLALAPVMPVHAEDSAATTPTSVPRPEAAPASVPAPAVELAPVPSQADPVVQIIRAKLTEPSVGKDAAADDLAALEAFYGARSTGPLWVTDMGFSAKGQAVLFEIGKADDWGLAAAAFELPPAGALPPSPEARALAEIKLDLAMLEYARFARGGRLNPRAVSNLFDQTPPLRDPKTVLAEIEAASAPDQYLRSLHPKHEQFVRLRQALLKARGMNEESSKRKPAENERDIRRLVINMERWRWMPENLGNVYVWNNTPEFMLYVVKNGKTIFADKTLVGTIGYATPVFTADMKTVVFNPDWTAPKTVVTENLLPELRNRNYSILSTHKLLVNYQGNPVDPATVDWGRVNILNYTFTQKAGSENVLGKVKFLFPNKHTVYMHDTVPWRKRLFNESQRMIGHECVRMEKPLQFAEVLLAEEKGLAERQVKELWDKGVNSQVTIDQKIPVHMVYFTAVVDDAGKVSTLADVYGLDRKLATALFADATGFPPPPPESKEPQAGASSPARWTSFGGGIAASIRGFLSD
jgi:L,D-transpeptidase YcbB